MSRNSNSNNNSTPGSPPAHTTPVSSPVVGPQRECDYDASPTPLYQAIEARRWDKVQSILDNDDNDDGINQAAVWVVRREHNGRLRWRLLPIHAAIIFQAPTHVMEALLHEYPAGAAAKDDQGMVPLHLALRNNTNKSQHQHGCINWHMVEDLLTAHPAAVFCRDRKGRTPLQGGLAAAAVAFMNNNNNNDTDSLQRQDQQQFREEHKAALSVLELYCNIVVAGERTKWKQQNAAPAETQQQWNKQTLAALAQQHAERLTELRDAFAQEQAARQAQHEQQIAALRHELAAALKEVGDNSGDDKRSEVENQVEEDVGVGVAEQPTDELDEDIVGESEKQENEDDEADEQSTEDNAGELVDEHHNVSLVSMKDALGDEQQEAIIVGKGRTFLFSIRIFHKSSLARRRR